MWRGISLNLLAFSLCCLSQQALPAHAAKATPPNISGGVIPAHSAGKITVPFEYFRQHIYITVSIDSKPGFIFMLDSGANRNILNLRTSRQLVIRPGKLHDVKDVGYGEGHIYVGPEENVDVEIGGFRLAESMSVIDLNQFEQHFHHPTDGMLGYPFLRHFVVKVDFRRKLLTLLPPDHFRYRGVGIEVRLAHSEDFVMMPVTVGSGRYDEHQVEVAVDSGSNGALMLYERAIRPLKLQNSFLRAQPEQAYGLDGYYSIARSSVSSFAIGNAQTSNLPVDYLRDEDHIGPDRSMAGAIGNGVLQCFEVVILDVPHSHIIFETKAQPWPPGLARTYIASQ